MTPKWYVTFKKIEDLERLLPDPNTSRPLKIIKQILFIIGASALVEFAMYLLYTAYEAKNALKNTHDDYCLKKFFVFAYDWYFDHFPFQCFIGIMLAASKCQATCLRNLTDILVMSITVYLGARFSCFNRKLLQEEKKICSDTARNESDHDQYRTRVIKAKTQRFLDQVFHSRLGLSGLKFFYVTRESILSVVATLIKYELVLLQFPERE
ncbi:PREDICTED: uncharacterized protein LOC106114574 [Papilio xuthus]|uniref:Uncharacterized protein LOC106114574 n=1 Tax=Papilio xuthus TaxID=66420 RepID=A0AAJ7E5B3_PAPXU|nr:PREDICTED: uncharacterized protein LOC106114574 [Papilio xuthus]